MDLGKRIRELRNTDTLKEVSEGTSLSVSYISDIERGRTNPSLQSLSILADHFGLSLTDLLASVDFAGEQTDRSLPAGLDELRHDELIGQEIDDEWIELLSKIELRGSRPQTKRQWMELYLNLKRILDANPD